MGLLMMNGIPYAGYTAPPEIYSLEECEVGVWIDGKPLYQKVLNIGTMPNATHTTFNHNIANIERMWIYDGYARNKANGFTNQLNLPNETLDGQWFVAVKNTTQLDIWAAIDRTAYNEVYVVVRYTKTTDTAGSGKWSPNGDLTHHYSTLEQVVGTWIDGKPIYEKTILLSESDFTKTNNWHWSYNFTSGVQNLDKKVKVTGTIKTSWNQYTITSPLFTKMFLENNNTDLYIETVDYYGQLALKSHPYNTSSYPKLTNVSITWVILVIQYTKTTD